MNIILKETILQKNGFLQNYVTGIIMLPIYRFYHLLSSNNADKNSNITFLFSRPYWILLQDLYYIKKLL